MSRNASRSSTGASRACAERERLIARASQAERRRDTRRKIIIGGTVLAAPGDEGVPALRSDEDLTRWLDARLERPADRAMFGLRRAGSASRALVVAPRPGTRFHVQLSRALADIAVDSSTVLGGVQGALARGSATSSPWTPLARRARQAFAMAVGRSGLSKDPRVSDMNDIRSSSWQQICHAVRMNPN